MSDLAATNCGGCGNDCGGMSSCMWIIILCLLCNNNCGCNGTSLFNNNGCGNDNCIWIILLLLFCGGNCLGLNNGCGCNNSCGCGCWGLPHIKHLNLRAAVLKGTALFICLYIYNYCFFLCNHLLSAITFLNTLLIYLIYFFSINY